MHKKLKSAIAKILMISLLFTQSSMMPAAYVMADSIEKTTQNAKKATNSEMDEANQIASDSDLDGELLENDLEPLPDGEMLENIDTATLSNAYALNRSLGPWDGNSEVEITPIGNTYYVTNPAELAWVSKVTNDGQESFEGKIVSILDDLDLGGHEWPGIGTSKNPFCGSFEGNNHSISGLVNEDSDCVGLFGSITANDDIYLRNLILDAAECSGIAKLDGLLVGQIHINGKTKVTIFNMDISGELNIVRGGGGIVNKWHTGGVVGKVTSGDGASLEINKVKVSGDIRVACARNWESSLCGGLVGYSELSGIMEITDSSFSGNIETEAGEGTAVGGLVGQTMNATLRFRLVHVEGSLKGTGSSATNVGGFIGDASCPTLDIQDSYVTADVISGSSGNSAPGGLIGCLNCQLDYAESFIKNCHISGGVSGRNSAVYIANNGSETETVSVENCYYDKSKPGLDTEHVITCLVALRTITLECSDIQGLTAEESMMESSYLDWDFMNVWTLEEGDYPKLRENVVLNKGLLVGMDSEVLIYYLPEERYETESFDLNYEYCIDETEILEGDIQTEDVLAQIKIRLPQGFSFSPDETVTESFVSDSRAPEGYVYVNLGEQGRGSIRVYTTKDLEKAESFRFRISINATGFEAYSSYSDMSVAMRNEQPGYVPEDAVYNAENGHYYKAFDQPMSWDEAKEYCEALKGHLVTITSQQEQYFVNRLLKGITKKHMWIGAELVSEKWHWILPEDWKYTNWGNGEPDCVDGELAAVMIYTYSGVNVDGKEVTAGSWKDALKDSANQEEYVISDVGFVCEWESVDDYRNSVMEFNGNRYKLFVEYLSWDDASLKCKEMGGHLVTITSEEEQQAIQNMIEQSDVNHLLMNNEYIWIGLTKEIDQKWNWNTGEEFSYQNWCEAYDSAYENVHAIIYNVGHSTGKWNTENSNSKRVYICEWEKAEVKLDALNLPVLSEKSARAFLGYLYNKADMRKKDLSEDKIYLLLIGKVETPEEQYQAALAFLEILHGQMEGHLKEATQAKVYLSNSIQKYLEKQMTGQSQLPQEIYNSVLNEHMGRMEEFMTDVLCAGAYKLTSVVVTETMLENLKQSFSAYSKVVGLTKKIDKFVDSTRALVQFGFLVLESEFEGRYRYFDLYLQQRKNWDPSDDIFRYIMNYNKFVLTDNNSWSGLLFWLPWISSWQQQAPIIEEWAEYTYQLQARISEVEEKSKFFDGNYHYISIQCPVNVFVIDDQGNECGSICDGVITNNVPDDLFLYQLGESKIVCVPEDSNLKIEIIAKDKGYLSYTDKIIENHKEMLRYNYYKLPLEAGDKYIANNSQNRQYEILTKLSSIHSEEKDLKPMESFNNQENAVYLEIEVEGDGEFIGENKYTKGDYACMRAVPKTDAAFIGWYLDDICVSKNIEYGFTIMSDSKYIAKFSDNNKQENNDGNNPDKKPDEDEPPTKPVNPDQEEQPTIPAEPEKPGESELPTKPADPDQEGQPTTPVEPENPDQGSSDGGGSSGNSHRTGENVNIPYIYSGFWESFGEKWRFILDNGSYAGMSWIYYKGKWYAIGQDGYMLVGWHLIGKEWYYFNSDGAMAVGWVTYDNQKYYLNPISDGSQGRMLTGWQLVDGKWYYFKKESDGTKGMLLTDTWIDKYYVNQEETWEENRRP